MYLTIVLSIVLYVSEEAVKTFAYVNIDIVGDNLNKCKFMYCQIFGNFVCKYTVNNCKQYKTESIQKYYIYFLEPYSNQVRYDVGIL